MNASQRQRWIQQRVLGLGEVEVDELAAQLGVSSMTIRRDLAILEDEGIVTRTHGGAVPARGSVVAFAFDQRRNRRLAAKHAIAVKAASFFEPGMSVVIDTGTTTLALVSHLRAIGDLRVLTTSLAIASELYSCENTEVVLLGGRLNSDSPDLYGDLAVQNLRQFRVDLAILGADGLQPDGLYTENLQVAALSRTMLDIAASAMVIADSTKFRHRAFSRYASWDRIDDLITDSHPEFPIPQWACDGGGLPGTRVHSVFPDESSERQG